MGENNNNKTLVFDMDGTIADLYAVEGWLEKLRACDATPYLDAEPLVNISVLNTTLEKLKARGWKVVVVSWGAKGIEYDNPYFFDIAQAKLKWLQKQGLVYDDFYILPYGVSKRETCDKAFGEGIKVLIDDDASVRADWGGLAINPTQVDIPLAIDTTCGYFDFNRGGVI